MYEMTIIVKFSENKTISKYKYKCLTTKKKLTSKMGTYYSLTTIMASNLDFTNQVL